jgi:hypothetical protein
MPTRRNMMGIALGATFAGGVARPSLAAPGMVSASGFALDGYDSVAFWSAHKAAKGQPAVSFKWNGATWIFGSPANRDAFAANPGKYAPAFNGYCVY